MAANEHERESVDKSCLKCGKPSMYLVSVDEPVSDDGFTLGLTGMTFDPTRRPYLRCGSCDLDLAGFFVDGGQVAFKLGAWAGPG